MQICIKFHHIGIKISLQTYISNFLRQKRDPYKLFMEGIDFVLSAIQNSEVNWSKVTQDSCKMTKLVGNSNKVYLVQTSLPMTPKNLVFRIFGSGETLDINTNSSIFHRLAENKIAPLIYLETSEYRLEEYLENTRTLGRLECLEPKVAHVISKELKIFHSQDLSDILNSRVPVCLTNVQKWRRLGLSKLSKISNSTRQNEVTQSLDCISSHFYDMYIDILPKGSPIVLSHMDTSFLNFLYNEEKEEIRIIDYDYSGYCYRGFDIAMLLQDIKYDYNYPCYPFYQYSPEAYPGDFILAEYVKAYGEGIDMFIECKQCMIAAHYLWAMWAFTLHEENGEGMDMLGYGLLRFGEFLKGYQEFKDMNNESMRRYAATYFSNP